MTELSKAVAQSGALDEHMLSELAKWRLPLELPEGDPADSPEAAVEAIEAALEGQSAVEVRATDLDVLRQYLATQAKGRLHIVTDIESGTFPVNYGVSKFGDYIIPWKADSLVEYLTNGKSHLRAGGKEVYFASVQELFFGERKVFILCVPIKESNGAAHDES